MHFLLFTKRNEIRWNPNCMYAVNVVSLDAAAVNDVALSATFS